MPPTPYSLPCVRELLRFLVSLVNPYDQHNTDVMIHMGLSLLTIAFESGADHIARFQSLLALVKDEMAKNLVFVSASPMIVSCSVFSRPYWVVRSRLWYDVLSVCHLSVCNVCIVAKWYVVEGRRWYRWIGWW